MYKGIYPKKDIKNKLKFLKYIRFEYFYYISTAKKYEVLCLRQNYRFILSNPMFGNFFKFENNHFFLSDYILPI
jgi:hypothetical protein